MQLQQTRTLDVVKVCTAEYLTVSQHNFLFFFFFAQTTTVAHCDY